MDAHPVTARSRLAVSTTFFVNGAVLASWVPHIPAVKAAHRLDDAQLGGVLLAMAVGSVVALPMAGWVAARFGSRRTTLVAALGLCAALPLPVLSTGVPLLVGALVLLGASNATLDVAMNAQAVVVERGYGRPIMSSFHALFSAGGLAGAVLAGLAMAGGGSAGAHVLAAAAAGMVAIALVARWLVPSPAEPDAGPRLAWPGVTLLGLGLMAFCGLVTEGAMGDWSAVFLHDVLATTPAQAAAGFAAFSLAMAAGRFGGDRLVERFGAVPVLRASGVGSAAGLTVALLAERPMLAVVGCGAVGLGIANVVPILFSAAGRTPGIAPAAALAGVATMGYLGFLAGPPVIGLVADAAGLRIGLAVVGLLCAVIAGGASLARRNA